MKKTGLIIFAFLCSFSVQAAYLMIPMDDSQKNHLKAYGIAYWVLQQDVEVDWLLNYRGGSFLFKHYQELEKNVLLEGFHLKLLQILNLHNY